jgi:asparagine synthase (glutamine-hydrolysing)
VGQPGLGSAFFGRDLAAAERPGFAHAPRWSSGSALQRLLDPGFRSRIQGVDVRRELLERLPEDFPRWTRLAQDQYIEIRTLLSGYLLSSQGDRMLMAHSVEGRFPFLDRDVVELAASLPDAFKLRVLDEKHVLKRSAAGLLPEGIVERKKQPYRAPDALAFSTPGSIPWADELLSAQAVRSAGVLDPGAVAALWAKCRSSERKVPPSNADNMALLGALSTQVVWDRLIRQAPSPAPLPPGLVVDRLVEPPPAERKTP